MENKKKNIELINIAVNPERKIKTQREVQVLEVITEEMNKRKIKEQEKMLRAKRQREKKEIKVAMGGLAAAVAFTIGGCQLATNYEKSKNSNSAQQEEKISFTSRKEMLEAERENLLAFLKNMYIEQYEETTGDTTKTTADIVLKLASYEDYAFVNRQTGEIITHGDEPETTKQKLINAGGYYERVNNLKLYKVYNTQGDIIDCITMEDGKPIKVTIGEQFGENTQSILAEMGNVIPCGLDCIGYIENGNKNDISKGKADFMKALEEFKKGKEDKEVEEMDYEFEL